MKRQTLSLAAVATLFLMARFAGAQDATPAAPPPAPTGPLGTQRTVKPQPATPSSSLYSLSFESAPLEIVMDQYCEWAGRTLLKPDGLKATITLKGKDLTKEECLEAIEAVLGMNNIAIVPMGEKFLKIVQATTPDLGGQGLQLQMDQEKKLGNSDKLVSCVIQLRNVTIPEVQAAVQHLMHAYGKIQALENSNSLLVTDTESNINRIKELLDFIDQAAARIEQRIYHLQYAEAEQVAAKLNEIISMAQNPKSTGPTISTPTGVMRPGSPVTGIRAATPRPASPTQATISRTEGSPGAIIQGTVKLVSDERTNIIMIFSQKENFDFFDTIIKVLDVEVAPAVTFEVVNLEYADADELSGTLNDLVGAAQGSSRSSSSGTSGSSSSSRRTSSSSSRSSGLSSRTTSSSSRSSGSSPSNPTANSSMPVAPKTVVSDNSAAENLSRLSENTKILSDKRSNSILLMGKRSDIDALKTVIAKLDVMLEQVMIEAAIFEVTLGDSLEHGIDWIYKDAKANPTKVGAWNGSAFVGSTNSLTGYVAANALTYYQNLTGIDTEMAIRLAASDSNVRLLATPIIMTTDNTEADLSVGEQRPVVTSTASYANSAGTSTSSYEYKDIGIQMTVTPRINPQRVVVMDITQKADQVGRLVTIDNNDVPTILNREFSAQIAVPDRGTVALGGLINTDSSDTVTKIPILGDIPLIGRYLFSHVSKNKNQTELVVLMTPYVLTNEKEMIQETQRIYDATDMRPTDWPAHGWSGSMLQHRPKEDGTKKPGS